MLQYLCADINKSCFNMCKLRCLKNCSSFECTVYLPQLESSHLLMSRLCITIVKRSSSRVEYVVSQYHAFPCPLGAGASSFLAAPPASVLSACFLFPAFMSIPAIVAMTALINQKNHLLEKYLPKVARNADVAMAKPTAIEMPRVN